MSRMFNEASSFNQNISDWNVSAVTNMNEMFYGATAFNQGIGNWSTSNVTNMLRMFALASFFDRDLGNWNLSSVTNMNQMFFGATALSNINKGKIHASFSSNQNWSNDWRQYVVIDDSNFQTAVNLWFSNQVRQ